MECLMCTAEALAGERTCRNCEGRFRAWLRGKYAARRRSQRERQIKSFERFQRSADRKALREMGFVPEHENQTAP